MTGSRYETLPCGCRVGTEELDDGGKAFVMIPCALDCRYYVYAMEETRRQGKDVRIVDAS